MPFHSATRGTEGFSEITTAPQGVELGQKPEHRLGQIFAFDENTTEGPLIEGVMLFVCEPRLPLFDAFKKLAVLVGIAHQTEMPCDTPLVSREKLVAG